MGIHISERQTLRSLEIEILKYYSEIEIQGPTQSTEDSTEKKKLQMNPKLVMRS